MKMVQRVALSRGVYDACPRLVIPLLPTSILQYLGCCGVSGDPFDVFYIRVLERRMTLLLSECQGKEETKKNYSNIYRYFSSHKDYLEGHRQNSFI